MKAERFVDELYSRTYNNRLQWIRVSNVFEKYDAYKLVGDNEAEVVLRKFDVSHYEADGNVYEEPQCVLEINDVDGKELGCIYPDDLSDPSGLLKLYNAAKRDANDVDSITDGFFGD